MKWVARNPRGNGPVSQYGSMGRPNVRGWIQPVPHERGVWLFGGSSSTYMSDTWLYDYMADFWYLLHPHPDLAGPCRRDNHNTVYLSDGRIWLSGGISYDNMQPGCLRERHWTYTDKWNAEGTLPLQGGYSNRLAAAAAVYSNKVYIFGGSVTNAVNETWRVDPSNWSSVRLNVDGAVGVPPKQINIQNAMAWVPPLNAFLLASRNGQTWLLDPVSGTWSRPFPRIEFTARELHAVAYYPPANKVILHGGRAGAQILNDTWMYDLDTNTWIDITETAGPYADYHHGIVYTEYGTLMATRGAGVRVFGQVPRITHFTSVTYGLV